MRRFNEITGISATVGQTWVTPEYDPAGNMTTIPQPKNPTKHFTATYDAWNRLVRLTKPADQPSSSSSSSSSSSTGGLLSSSSSSASSALNSSSSSSTSSSSSSSEPEEVLIAEYEYDARRFRIRERTYEEGVLQETRDVYFTESWRAIEERIPPQTFPWAERQYVWGVRYIDDCVLRDRFNFGGGLADRFYALQDANWNVVAITNDEGAVQERYAYTAYGEPTFLQPDFSTQNASQFGWQTLFQSMTRDVRSGLVAARNRYLMPVAGIWLTRDPANAGARNLYEGFSSKPESRVDPLGLDDFFNMAICPSYPVPFGYAPDYGQQYLLGQGPSSVGAETMHDIDKALRRLEPARQFVDEQFPRIGGGLRVAGGFAESLVGAAALATPEPTMATKVLGWGAAAHGADTTWAGMRQLWTGEHTPTLTQQGVTAVAASAGADLDTAYYMGAFTEAGLGMGFSAGAGLLSGPGAVANRVSAAHRLGLYNQGIRQV